MRVEVSEGIDDRHWKHLTQWKERVFPEEGRGMEWAQSRWHLVGFSDEGQAIAHIGFNRFPILVDGQPRDVVGVGGVVVRPEFQGRGLPAQLFAVLHERGQALAGSSLFTLFCPARLVPYYSKHGYTRHNGRVQFLQRGALVTSDFEFMHRGGIDQASDVQLLTPPW